MTGTLAEVAEQVATELGIPAATPMTDEQAAQFREEFARRYAEEASKPLQVLPHRPLLTPETARELLRECVTVVKPGEVLVIRMSRELTPNQFREIAEMTGYWLKENAPGVKVMLVPAAEEFAVTVPGEES